MKKVINRIIATILCAVMMFGSVPFLNSIFIVDSQAASVYTKEQIGNYRKKLYDYMKTMATLEWTASKTYTYQWWSSDSSRKVTIKKGWKMLGIPYKNYGSCKYSDMDIKKKLTVKDGVNYLGEDVGHNDCSTAVALSFYHVISDFKTTGCSQARFYPWSNSDFVPVGSYTVAKGLANTKKVSGNKAKIYEGYAQVKKGDILVNGGHVMMVKSVNAANKKVKVIDQAGVFFYGYKYNADKKAYSNCGAGKYPSGSRRSTWNIDHNVSFDSLWKNNYIPVQFKRFRSEEKAPSISLSVTSKDNGSATVTANVTKQLTVLKAAIVYTTDKKLITKDFTTDAGRQKAKDAKCYKNFYSSEDGQKTSTASYTIKKLKYDTNYYLKMIFSTPSGWIQSDAFAYNLAGIPTQKSGKTTIPYAQEIKYSDWGAWSGWSTKSVAKSDTVDVETRTAYQYYHYCEADGECSPVKDSAYPYFHLVTTLVKQPTDTENLNGKTYEYIAYSKSCPNECNEYFVLGTTTAYRYRTRQVIGN